MPRARVLAFLSAVALAALAGAAYGLWTDQTTIWADYSRVKVLDGDSLVFDNRHRIRLAYIDSPELAQTCKAKHEWNCGYQSKLKLIELIAGRPVECRKIETDKYNRIIANCYAGSISLNKEMVRSGFAIAYRRYSYEYVSEELEAMKAKRGIWSGQFELPEEYRVKNTQR